VWQAVPTSSVAFTNAGTIASGPASVCTADGDISNMTEYNCIEELANPGNAVIFDEAGVIHDNLFGVGNSTLGFAGPRTTSIGGVASFSAFRAVINGEFRDGVENKIDPTPPNDNRESTQSEFEAALLHGPFANQHQLPDEHTSRALQFWWG
jgi:hypothetical protein